MNKTTHPIEPEELMAYLDGELSAERAAEAAAHLSQCSECQSVVVKLQGVSHSLKSWHVQLPNSQLCGDIVRALAKQEGRQGFAKKDGWKSHFLRWPTLAWVTGLAAVAVLMIVSVSVPNLLRVREAAERARLEQFSRPQKAPAGKIQSQSTESRLQETVELIAPEDESKETTGSSVGGPMIIRTAELTLTTKEFDKARARLEEILKRHRGYVADLKVGGATGNASSLTATLRVPADQLDATLTDMKTLGRVESESQGGQDVTSQYVDLQARLANARNTEKRLTDLLSQRTGKLSDVLAVERELDRVRGEIERMEAERKNMANQVSLATLNVTISEEYKAQLEAVPPSTATRLSNAAVEGYRSMVDGVVSVMLLLLSTGPSFVLWAAVLFLPARLAWKTMRRRMAQ